jgi:hypothetical protein
MHYKAKETKRASTFENTIRKQKDLEKSITTCLAGNARAQVLATFFALVRRKASHVFTTTATLVISMEVETRGAANTISFGSLSAGETVFFTSLSTGAFGVWGSIFAGITSFKKEHTHKTVSATNKQSLILPMLLGGAVGGAARVTSLKRSQKPNNSMIPNITTSTRLQGRNIHGI